MNSRINLSLSPKRLLSEAFAVLSGSVAWALASFVTIRVLTEYLTQPEFGVYGLLVGMIMLGHAVAGVAVRTTASRFFSESVVNHYTESLHYLLYYVVLLVSILTLSLGLIGGIVFVAVQGQKVPLYFILLLPTVIVGLGRSIEISLLKAARRQYMSSIWRSLEEWLKVLLYYLSFRFFAVTLDGVFVVYFGVIATLLVIYNFTFLSSWLREIRGRLSKPDEKKLVKYILTFATPMAIAGILGWGLNYSPRYLISAKLSLAEVGIYTAALGLVNRPAGMISTTLTQTLSPIYFSAVTQKKWDKVRKIFTGWLFASAFTMIAYGALALIFYDVFVRLILAESYIDPVRPLVPWLILGMLFQFLSHPYRESFIAYKKPSYRIHTNIISTVVVIASVWWFTSHYGLVGAGMASVVYFFMSFVVSVIYSILAKRSYMIAEGEHSLSRGRESKDA